MDQTERLLRKAIESDRSAGLLEAAAGSQCAAAMQSAEFGDVLFANDSAAAALLLREPPSSRPGQTRRAALLAADLEKN